VEMCGHILLAWFASYERPRSIIYPVCCCQVDGMSMSDRLCLYVWAAKMSIPRAMAQEQTEKFAPEEGLSECGAYVFLQPVLFRLVGLTQVVLLE
jgi:hypothetical protein